MAASKQAARAKSSGGPAAPVLPPVTVARFEESLRLVERIYLSQQEGFLQQMQDFRAQHRDVTQRPLTAEEATRFAAAMSDVLADGTDPAEYAAQLQNSDLYAYEQPGVRDVLIAAGMATAPALVQAAGKFVALMEMAPDRFVACFEDGTLPDAVDEDARALAHVPLAEARARTVAALEHWAAEAGVSSGEALRSLIEAVTGALEQAAARITATNGTGLSELSRSSTGSPAPTGGPAEPSSTTPGIATP